jgi:hypothetical protein
VSASTPKPTYLTPPMPPANFCSSSSSTPKDETTSMTYRGQLRRHSLLESTLSISLGFIIALITQHLVFPLFGIKVTFSDQLGIAAIFTVVSILRSYAIRRLFNYFHIKGIL